MARAVAMLLQAALVLLVASTMAADVEDGVTGASASPIWAQTTWLHRDSMLLLSPTDIASFSELDEMHPGKFRNAVFAFAATPLSHHLPLESATPDDTVCRVYRYSPGRGIQSGAA